MISSAIQNSSKVRAISVDIAEFRQFAFLAIALVLEFTTMVAG